MEAKRDWLLVGVCREQTGKSVMLCWMDAGCWRLMLDADAVGAGWFWCLP